MEKSRKPLGIICAWTIAMASIMNLTGCISSGSNVDPVLTGETGRSFPQVVGINLEGTDVKIPEGLEGKNVLVIVAFKREQQEIVNTWLPKLQAIENSNQDFRFYELPIVYKGGAAFRFWVNNGMRSGITDKESRLRTITVYTDQEAFAHLSLIPSLDNIYLFLLNADRQITWRSEGSFSLDKFDELKQLL